jgi:thymidylate kinase
MLKAESSLVIIDRYYYDYFVDVRRYRLKLPQSLLWGMMKVIPKPDIVVYLHNSPDALYARKQELTPEELTRQVRKFQEILPRLPNVRKVDTDKPMEEVAREITSAILDFMELRMKERLR